MEIWRILWPPGRVDAAQSTLNLARVIAPFAGTVTESYPLSGDQVGRRIRVPPG